MKETQFENVVRKTGKKPVECKCHSCKMQCKNQTCIGTPEDMEKLVNAGYSNRLAPAIWHVGKMYGIIDHDVNIIAPRFDKVKGACTFFTEDGLCELHEKGLKPTEGRLSIHTTDAFSSIQEFKKKSIAWAVIKHWM